MVTTSATTTDTASTENSHTNYTDNTHQQQRCVHHIASITQVRGNHITACCMPDKQAYRMSLSESGFTTADAVSSCRYAGVPHEISLSDGKETTCTEDNVKKGAATVPAPDLSTKKVVAVSEARTCKARSCKNLRSKLSVSAAPLSSTAPSNGACCNEMKVICGETVMVQQDNSLVISDLCLDHRKSDDREQPINDIVLNKREHECDGGVSICNSTINGRVCGKMRELNSLSEKLIPDSEEQSNLCQEHVCLSSYHCLHINQISENFCKVNDPTMCSTKTCGACGSVENVNSCSCNGIVKCVAGINNLNSSALTSNCTAEFSTMERECGLKINEQAVTYTPLSSASGNMSIMQDTKSAEEKYLHSVCSVRCSLPLSRIKDVLKQLGLSDSEINVCVKKEQGLNKENSECTIDTSVTSTSEMKSILVSSTKIENVSVTHDSSLETSSMLNNSSEISSNSNTDSDFSSNCTSSTNVSLNSSFSDTSNTVHLNLQTKTTRRLFCLYCDRTFVNLNLRQKHIDRTHSIAQSRRSSSRTPSHNQLSPVCMYCGKSFSTAEELNKLFEHLVTEHSVKYNGCLLCTERFTSKEILREHNEKIHGIFEKVVEVTSTKEIDNHSDYTLSKTNSTDIAEKVHVNTEEDKYLTNCKLINDSKIEVFETDRLKKLENCSTGEFVSDFDECIQPNIISGEVLIMQTKKADEDSKSSNDKMSVKKLKCVPKTKTIGNTQKTTPRSNRRTTRSCVTNAQLNSKSKNKQLKVNLESMNELTKLDINKEIVTKNDADIQSVVVKENDSTPPVYEFDENFFSCVSFNIRDNLMNHLDGKLFHISDTTANDSSSVKNLSDSNSKQGQESSFFGNNLALTAITPITTLLTSQSGIDSYQQIEYGSKAPVVRRHFVKYNFRSRKQKNTEYDIPKDVSKLDMWTQIAMKLRQQKVKNLLVGKSNERYTISDDTCRKAELQVEELNRILDMRGPFQDLREEAMNSTQKLFEEKRLSAENNENSDEIKIVIEDILINVFEKSTKPVENTYTSTTSINLDKFISDRLKLNLVDDSKKIIHGTIENKTEINSSDLDACYQIVTRSRLHNENSTSNKTVDIEENRPRHPEVSFPKDDEIPNYFKLFRNNTTPSTSSEDTKLKTINETLYSLGIDSRQIENFLSDIDLNVIVTSAVELSGEWARPRIYICGACGVKVPNLKQLEDHKFFAHPYIWCMHYEFVGNQSDFYLHLNIPGLGRMLEIEESNLASDFIWNRSTSRACSKCNKQCNSLGDLHRHMLECGGDWTWMLAKKKCKYRPYGSRRRRQRGMKRNLSGRLTVSSEAADDEGKRRECRRDRSKLSGPRPPRPSDAETIQRMLANLPPKRTSRKILSFKEGVTRKRKINPNLTPPNPTVKSKLLLNKSKPEKGSQKSKYKFKSARLRKLNNKTESALTSSIKAASKKMKQTLQKNLRDRNHLQKTQNQNRTSVDKVNSSKVDSVKSTLLKVKSKAVNKICTDASNTEVSQFSNNSEPINKVVDKTKNNIFSKVLSSKVIDTTTASGPKTKTLRSMNKLKSAVSKIIKPKNKQKTPTVKISDDKTKEDQKMKNSKPLKKVMTTRDKKNTPVPKTDPKLAIPLKTPKVVPNKSDDCNSNKPLKAPLLKKSKILRRTRAAKLTTTMFRKKLRSSQMETTSIEKETISNQKNADLVQNQQEIESETKIQIELNKNVKSPNDVAVKTKQGINKSGKIVKKTKSLKSLTNLRKTKLNSLRKSVRTNNIQNVLIENKKELDSKKKIGKMPFKRAISVDGLVHFDCASNDSLNSLKVNSEDNIEEAKNVEENTNKTKIKNVFKPFKKNLTDFINKFQKKDAKVVTEKITSVMDVNVEKNIVDELNDIADANRKEPTKKGKSIRSLSARLSKRISKKIETIMDENINSNRIENIQPLNPLTKSVSDTDLNKKNAAKRKTSTFQLKNILKKEENSTETLEPPPSSVEIYSSLNNTENVPNEENAVKEKCDTPPLCSEQINDEDNFKTMPVLEKIKDQVINREPLNQTIPILSPVINTGSNKRKPSEIKKIQNVKNILPEDDPVFDFNIIPVRENMYPICNLSTKKNFKEHLREPGISKPFCEENLKYPAVVDYVPDFENEVLDLSIRKNKDIEETKKTPTNIYSTNYNLVPFNNTNIESSSIAVSKNETSSIVVPKKVEDKPKSKNVKKPTRGLNDCIAMLTCKLQQKLINPITSQTLDQPIDNPRVNEVPNNKNEPIVDTTTTTVHDNDTISTENENINEINHVECATISTISQSEVIEKTETDSLEMSELNSVCVEKSADTDTVHTSVNLENNKDDDAVCSDYDLQSISVENKSDETEKIELEKNVSVENQLDEDEKILPDSMTEITQNELINEEKNSNDIFEKDKEICNEVSDVVEVVVSEKNNSGNDENTSDILDETVLPSAEENLIRIMDEDKTNEITEELSDFQKTTETNKNIKKRKSKIKKKSHFKIGNLQRRKKSRRKKQDVDEITNKEQEEIISLLLDSKVNEIFTDKDNIDLDCGFIDYNDSFDTSTFINESTLKFSNLKKIHIVDRMNDLVPVTNVDSIINSVAENINIHNDICDTSDNSLENSLISDDKLDCIDNTFFECISNELENFDKLDISDSSSEDIPLIKLLNGKKVNKSKRRKKETIKVKVKKFNLKAKRRMKAENDSNLENTNKKETSVSLVVNNLIENNVDKELETNIINTTSSHDEINCNARENINNSILENKSLSIETNYISPCLEKISNVDEENRIVTPSKENEYTQIHDEDDVALKDIKVSSLENTNISLNNENVCTENISVSLCPEKIEKNMDTAATPMEEVLNSSLNLESDNTFDIIPKIPSEIITDIHLKDNNRCVLEKNIHSSNLIKDLDISLPSEDINTSISTDDNITFSPVEKGTRQSSEKNKSNILENNKLETEISSSTHNDLTVFENSTSLSFKNDTYIPTDNKACNSLEQNMLSIFESGSDNNAERNLNISEENNSPVFLEPNITFVPLEKETNEHLVNKTFSLDNCTANCLENSVSDDFESNTVDILQETRLDVLKDSISISLENISDCSKSNSVPSETTTIPTTVHMKNSTSVPLEYLNTSISLEDMNTSLPLDNMKVSVILEDINKSPLIDDIVTARSNNINLIDTSDDVREVSSHDIISSALENSVISISQKLDIFTYQKDLNDSIPEEEDNVCCPEEKIVNNNSDIDSNLALKENAQIIVSQKYDTVNIIENDNICTFDKTDDLADRNRITFEKNPSCMQKHSLILYDSGQENMNISNSQYDDFILQKHLNLEYSLEQNNEKNSIDVESSTSIKSDCTSAQINTDFENNTARSKSPVIEDEYQNNIFSNMQLINQTNGVLECDTVNKLSSVENDFRSNSRLMFHTNSIVENEGNAEMFNSDILNQNSLKNNKIFDEKLSEYNSNHVTKIDYNKSETVDSGKENNNVDLSKVLTKSKSKRNRNKRKTKVCSETLQTVPDNVAIANGKISFNNNYTSDSQNNILQNNLNLEVNNLISNEIIDHSLNKEPCISVSNDSIKDIVSICGRINDDCKNISSTSPLSSDSEDEIPLSKFLSSRTNTNTELDTVQNSVEDIASINLPKLIEELTPILEEKELNILENIENIDEKNDLLDDESKEINILNADEKCKMDVILQQKDMIESFVDEEILDTVNENHIDENDSCNVLNCEIDVANNEIETCLEQPKVAENDIQIYEFSITNTNFEKKTHRKKKGKISKLKKHSSKSKHNSDVKKTVSSTCTNNEKVEPIILHLSRKTSNSSTNNDNSDFVITEIKGNKEFSYSKSHRNSIELDVLDENVSISSIDNIKSSNTSFSIDNDIDNLNSDDFPEQSNDFEEPEKEQSSIADRHSPVLLKIKTNKMKKLTRKMKKSRKTVTKIKETIQSKKSAVIDHFCEICNKHFCRADNLTKHKMTFTHIAKLSEIEAKQDELRRKEQKEIELNAIKEANNVIEETYPKDENNEHSLHDSVDSFNNVNKDSSSEKIVNSEKDSKNYSSELLQNDIENKNSNIDINLSCNTVTLNSEDDGDDDNDIEDDDDIGNESYQLGSNVNYPDLVISNQPKRYRSLGERKSFDLNPITSPPKSLEEINSELSNTKIPENYVNSTSDNYINNTNKDDDMIGEDEKLTNSTNVTCKKIISSHITKFAEKNKESFLLSNDTSDTSNKKQCKNIGNFNTNRFDENYSGKKLNRDEELFLECCSLLKSSSESHKLNKKINSDPTNFKFKTVSGDSFDFKPVEPNEENINNSRSENWSSSDSVASDWISNRDSASNTPFGAVLINNTSYKWLEQEKQIRSKSNSLTDVRFEDVSSNSNSILINQDNLDIQYEDISVSSVESIPYQHYANANEDQEQLSENEEDQTSNELVDNVDINSCNREQNTSSFNNFINVIDDAANLLMANEVDSDNIEGTLCEENLKNELQTEKEHEIENIIQTINESNTEQSNIAADLHSTSSSNEVPTTEDEKDTVDSSTEANKKILTKGAKKVFEGIRVSIPTHELNLSEMLNCSMQAKSLNEMYDKSCDDQNLLAAANSKNNVSFGLKLYKNGVEVSQSVLKSFKNKLSKTSSESNFADGYIVTNGSKRKNSGFFNRVGNKLGFREVKRGKSQKSKGMKSRYTKMKSGMKKQETPKVKDIYDFEDTQDNDGLGLFNSENTLPLFKSFRSQKIVNASLDTRTNDLNTDNNLSDEANVNKSNNLDSDSEPYPYIDSLSVDNSPSSEEDVPVVKSRNIQKKRVRSRKRNVKNDNQKKCMIMGRIFKHVVKSKPSESSDVADPENSKLLEGHPKKGSVKVDASVNIKLSEKEIDSIFDALLGRDSSAIEKEVTKLKKIDDCSASSHLERLDTLENKIKQNIDSTYTLKTEVVVPSSQAVQKSKKYKKPRARTDSSSDDEFCLSAKKPVNKSNRKRTFKKQKLQQTLNLEQEIRECIGVAGRKSQRKCTSGKQNVLVEFWSSDELSDAEVDRKKILESAVVDGFKSKSADIPDTTALDVVFQNDTEEVEENNEMKKQNNCDVLIKNNVSDTSALSLEKSMNGEKTTTSLPQKIVFKTKSSRLHSMKRKILPRKRPLKRVKRSEKCSKVHRKSNTIKRRNTCSVETKERPVTIAKPSNKDQLSQVETIESLATTRRKRSASEKLYYWSSSSEDEFEDLIEVKPIREDPDDDRPIQHGWIVGDSPKKLVTLLAHAKGKKIDAECVKEQGKRNKVSA